MPLVWASQKPACLQASMLLPELARLYNCYLAGRCRPESAKGKPESAECRPESAEGKECTQNHL